jgi:Asp-tRNA(Asn)/Glu-tRNA(Gln) amidotransferase A subunit family amidase
VESARTHRQALLDANCAPAVEAVALAGLVIPRQWHDAAREDRARRTREFVAQHLQEHDVFMAPALPDPIPDWADVTQGHASFNAKRLLGMHRYMSFVNYLGLPSLVMPVAKDARGMPISVQLVARPFHESLLLGFAHQLELRLFGAHGFAQQIS